MPRNTFCIWETELTQLLVAIQKITLTPATEQLSEWFHGEAIVSFQRSVTKQADIQAAETVFSTALQSIKLDFIKLFNTHSAAEKLLLATCYDEFSGSALTGHLLFINALSAERAANRYWTFQRSKLQELVRDLAQAVAEKKPEDDVEGVDNTRAAQLEKDIVAYIAFQDQYKQDQRASNNPEKNPDIMARIPVFIPPAAPVAYAAARTSTSTLLPIAPSFKISAPDKLTEPTFNFRKPSK